MPVSRWTPFVTVAAVVAHQGRYLLVEEHTAEGLRLNNPAGHLEPGESPQQAVVREALEETAREFRPEALVGVYLSRFVRAADGRDRSYLRIAYCGSVGEPLPGRALDQGIVGTVWLTADEIRTEAARLRSPLVQRCVEDHLAGRRLPLDTIHADPSVFAPRVDPGLR
jgi:ADP-ribose pyrophosphatase YjhB (NUDIX family)